MLKFKARCQMAVREARVKHSERLHLPATCIGPVRQGYLGRCPTARATYVWYRLGPCALLTRNQPNQGARAELQLRIDGLLTHFPQTTAACPVRGTSEIPISTYFETASSA